MTDAPITRRDLDEAMSGAQQQHDRVHAELQTMLDRIQTESTGRWAEIRTENAELRAALGQRPTANEVNAWLAASELRIKQHADEVFARYANALIDESRRHMNASLDPYRSLPAEQTTLRADLDAHANNAEIHR